MRTCLPFLFVLLLSCQSTPTEPTPKAPVDAPNILVILTDDQGYADMSAFGATDLRTPRLDALAEEGQKLNNFYANCPVCSPTRAALLTGRYQEFVGVPGVIRTYPEDNWGYLSESATLLPEPLNELGYHTAIIGKWHLGLEAPNTPNERGFQLFKGWLGDMMDDYVEKRRHGINYMRDNEQVIDPPGHATDIFTDWAVEYVEKQANSTQPFFLYLAYNAPHFPVQPKADWLAKVQAREPGLSEKRAKLLAFIEHLDDGIGQVVDALKASGQYENTLILFSSDNGGLLRDAANNGPWRDGKQSVYEGGLRVPAFAVWPGNIAPSTQGNHRILSMDLFPTVLEAAGASVTHSIEGKSFLPSLLGNPQPTLDERPVFFSRREGNLRYGGKTIEAVRLGDWKLLQNDPFGPRELYNMVDDPYETNNLIGQEPEKLKELNALLMQHLQQAGQVPWQRPADN